MSVMAVGHTFAAIVDERLLLGCSRHPGIVQLAPVSPSEQQLIHQQKS